MSGLGVRSDAPPTIDLERHLQAWRDGSNPSPLLRWTETELRSDGLPLRLPVEHWSDCFELLCRARAERTGGWPDSFATRIDGLFRWLIHFSRPDSSAILGPRGDRRSAARLVAGAVSGTDPGYASVVARWTRAPVLSGRDRLPTPLPALQVAGQAMAMLRTDWSAEGDWIAVDARSSTSVEVASEGRPWISGAWSIGHGSESVAKPTAWSSGPFADVFEWTSRSGPTRITRTAVLLRSRRVAILAQQEDGPPTEGFRTPLAPGTTAAPTANLRSWTLARSRKSARLLAPGLPSLPYPTDRGAFRVVDGAAVLTGPEGGRRRWLPIVVAWGRPPTHWRPLTVTERSIICPPEVAFGARIAWGPGEEGLVIYRSLARPALRVVLGHQTKARFLVGRFTAEGNVVPLVTLD